MLERRFRKADFYAARRRLHEQVAWTLMRAFTQSGYTLRAVAKKLQRPQSWVEARLLGQGDTSLRDVALIAWALDIRPKFGIKSMEVIEPRNLTFHPARWLKVQTATSVYALAQAAWNEQRLAA